ncbi:pentatricopeptide repeat-containing protein At5g40410, mitochondrial-like [Chenopodium quinoa]|nr:pentatricopeptide repeat-containing protein At5g40410, mitochondrial-like [Chenopodium quinoa]
MFLTNLTTHNQIYDRMQSLLWAVSCCRSLVNCQAIHAVVIKSQFINNGFIGYRLVSIYTSLGFNDYARKLFDEIPDKDLVSWNSFISGFSKRGILALCLNAFQRMRNETNLKPNEVTLLSVISTCTVDGALCEGKCFHGFGVKMGFMEEVKVVNALINMYGKLGMFDAAYVLFNSMKLRSLVTWNSILALHAQHGHSDEVVGLFNFMRRAGVKPDQATMVALLQGCTKLGVVKQATVVHACIFKCGFESDMLVSTSLMSLYAKSGQLIAANIVFGELTNPDAVAWTSMLASYAMHGCGSEAIKLFENMVDGGICLDHVTFTHLLSACSHAGLISEGRKYFEDMFRVYGVQPRIDHYSCIVDLLGRAGLLEDAVNLIRSMPMEPNSGVWGALLGACRIHNNVELGKEAADNLFLLNSSDHRNYIMMSNIYSASGHWKDASKIRSMMKGRRLVGDPGYSLIEHGNRVYQFVVGDQSHPNSDKIYAKLEEIVRKVHEAGLVRQTEFILHDVEEEVKIDMINKHSEKLALAFGLLVTNTSIPITIIKNLRICGDCHSVMKFVSLSEKRTIIVRDPKRFHHFADGMCSCKDYW